MPFYKYSVEPVRLSRKPLPPDKNIDDELEAVANNTLVQVLKQLSHLVTIADTIFLGVSVECRKINERTTKLKTRVDECERKANDLCAKRVTVPVGNLCSFSIVKEHYKTNYVFDSTSLFSQQSRPNCVKELVAKSTISTSTNVPSTSSNPERFSCPLQRLLEHYYWSESLVDEEQKRYRYIVCRPVIGESKWREHLDIETRKPARLKMARQKSEATLLKGRPNSVGQLDTSSSSAYLSNKEESFDFDDHTFSDGEESDIFDLPSPEERLFELAMEYPSTLVSVDVSGKGFQRMASLRRSLIHGDFLIKRKKRKTHKRNATSDKQVKNKENRNLETKSIQTETPDEIQNTASTSKSDTIFPKHKAFSNVRFRGNRHSSVVQSDRSSLYASVDIIGPRPDKNKRYSMDPKALSSLSTNNNENNNSSSKSSTQPKKAKGRGFLPISTLSAAMTVAVKLRGNIRGAVSGVGSGSKSKNRKEENGQSSSGNWSANSSIRGSGIDSSDTQKLQTASGSSTASHSSLEKDSVLSDTTTASKQERKANGYVSDISASVHSNGESKNKRHSKQDRKICQRNSPSGSSRSGTLTPERNGAAITNGGDSSSSFSPPSNRARKFNCQNGTSSATNDDESESVYSVDTDGYYTSMHTDSGLKNLSPKKLSNSEENNYNGRVCRRESNSSVSTIGNISLNSILSRNAFETSSNRSTFTYKAPPTPPPRATSIKFDRKSNEINEKRNRQYTTTSTDYEELPPPPPSPPVSEDADARERLEQKTKIKTCHYPFMCSVSPETSDEEPKISSDPLDYVLKDKSLTFVPLGLNMYGDISMKDKSFAPIMPETPPYTPSEELTLSSFASNHSSPSKTIQKDSSSIRSPPTTIRFPPPISQESLIKTGKPNPPLIPLKYAQHITVTPMLRNSKYDYANKSNNENTTGVLKARISPFIIRATQPPSVSSGKNANSIERPSTPSSKNGDGRITPGNDKPSAKVTLDSDGQVIFSSNSLGRRRDGHPMNYLHLSSPTKITERKYATLPTRLTGGPANNSAANGRCSSPSSHSKIGYSSLPRQILPRCSSNGSSQQQKVPYFASQNQTITNLKTPPPTVIKSSPDEDYFASQNQTIKQNQTIRQSQTKDEDYRNLSSSDSISKKSRMSNDDLFALIHSSKKKLNIKSDSEKNSSTNNAAAINNSNIPLLKRTPSKNELAESGCLSPRQLTPNKSTTFDNANYISAGGVNRASTPINKPTMVSDRLGTVRQTSLRDFKRLLSQKGSGTPSPGGAKKSASEILKSSSPLIFNTSNGTSSLPSSPCKELNIPAAQMPVRSFINSEDWDAYGGGGISTVPLKRGTRGRMSLQTRYDHYNCPPILEDCSEDIESNSLDESSHFRPISRYPQTWSSKSFNSNYRQQLPTHQQQDPRRQFNRFPNSSSATPDDAINVHRVIGTKTPIIKPATSTWV